MYKAIQEIDGFKIGDEVPEDKAKLWMEMYKFSPVEEVKEDGEQPKDGDDLKSDESGDEDQKDDSTGSGSILEDYLARGKNVVKKNVEEDELSEDQLKELLKMEKSDKKRESVIKAIEKRLKGLN